MSASRERRIQRLKADRAEAVLALSSVLSQVCDKVLESHGELGGRDHNRGRRGAGASEVVISLWSRKSPSHSILLNVSAHGVKLRLAS